MASEQSAQRELFGEIYVNNWSKLLRYAKANKSCAGVAEELVQDMLRFLTMSFLLLIMKG